MFEWIKAKYQALVEKLSTYDYERVIKNIFEKCRWFNIQLTTAFNIVTTVHWSVPLFLLIMLFFSQFQAGLAAIAFLSVIPHEYGHALAARWYGIQTGHIVLYPLGGVALLIPNKKVKLEKVRELVVAAAGPLVSLALAIAGFTMFAFTGPNLTAGETISAAQLGFWFWLGAINTGLFIFNLIPAFPMDGGRMLRSVIALFTDHVRSTQYAYYCSIFFCVVLALFGIVTRSLLLPFTMVVVHMLARMEYMNVRMQAEREAKKEAKPKPVEEVVTENGEKINSY